MKCRIYVGSLPFDGVTEAHIKAAFSPFGPITHINHCLVSTLGFRIANAKNI